MTTKTTDLNEKRVLYSFSPGKQYVKKLITKRTISLLIIDLILIISLKILSWGTISSDDQSSVSITQPFMEWLVIFIPLLITIVYIIYNAIAIPWLIRTLSYEILDQALVVRRGRLAKSINYVPYRTITNLFITKGPFDRMLGLAQLSIETAGTSLISGKIGVDQYIEGLDELAVNKIYEFIHKKMRKFKKSYTTTTEPIETNNNIHEELIDELKKLNKEIEELRKTIERVP